MPFNPLRRFMLAALLWLPGAFFLWFWLAAVLTWPVIGLAKTLLLTWWPQLFSAVDQHGFLMEVTTHLLVNQTATNGQLGLGELMLSVNPMVYGYPLPLFVGLVLATPQEGAKRPIQLAVGIVLILLMQVFGAVAETLKLFAFDTGPQGIAVIGRVGLSENVIALVYQFGYLILPAVTPAALWIVFNRAFIETLTCRVAVEPLAAEVGRK